MIETSEQVSIVDRGRGPQLSNSRMTVQDLLPLFKEGTPDAEILRWYPQIGQTELDLLRQYYRDHTEEVLTLEREIAAYNEEARKLYPRPPLPTDGMTTEEKRAWMLQRIADRKKPERNGVHGSAG
jgi:uncharacterized protein (DUF433 family)